MTWSSTDPRRRSGLSSIGANLNKLPHGFPCTGIPLDYLARIRACHPERSEGSPRQSGGFFASLRMTILARVIPAREIGVTLRESGAHDCRPREFRVHPAHALRRGDSVSPCARQIVP